LQNSANHRTRCKQEPNIQQAANSQDVAVTVQSGTDDGRKEIGDSRQSEVDIDTTGEGRQHVNVGDRRASEAETTVAIPTRDVDQGNPSPDIDTTGEVRQHVSVGDRRASEAEAKVATPTRDIEQDGIKGNRADVVSLIPELAVIGQEEQLEVRDCEEDFFPDNTLDKIENRILAHNHFKTFLITTLQWRPYTEKWERQKRRWVPFWYAQGLIICLIVLSFAFDMGLICKVDTILSYYKRFEITRIRNSLWEARWLFGNMIGLWYFRTRHFEWFLAAIKMPKLAWDKFDKRTKPFLLFLLFTCVIIPTAIQIWITYQFSKEPPHLWMAIVHIIGYGFRRYTTLPIFLALICILYLLDLFIKVSGQRVRRYLHSALYISASAEEGGTAEKQKESQNEKLNQATKQISACMEIIGHLKRVIFKTENGVKYFMLFHLVMLLLTSFLGMFSFMERLEFKVKSAKAKYNMTNDLYPESISRLHEANMVEERVQKAILSLADVQRALILNPNNKAVASNLSQVLNETMTSVLNQSRSREEAINMIGLQQTPVWQSIGVHLVEQINRTRLFIEMGLDCAETVLLYGLPLFWLIKIDSSVDAIKEHLVDLQGDQLAFNFKMTKEAWDVISFMKTVRGIRVFGFQSTLFRTLILTFAGPILLSVIHSLLSYVHMPK